MSTPRRHTLGKAEKLKSRKLIDQLFAQGRSFTAFPVKVVYLAAPQPPAPDTEQPTPVRVGVTASTRHFKRATDRNRIKRLLREVYRQQKHELHDAVTQQGLHLSVFFIYLDKELPTYALLQDKMRYCLKRLRKELVP